MTATLGPLGREMLDQADALYDHARHLTRNDTDAEELVQETYVRALAAAHSFSGGYLKAWMFKIMRNTFIDLYRRGRHQPVLSELDVIDGAVEGGSRGSEANLDPLPPVVAAEIETALHSLSEDARAIILLDLEGFTETEASEILDCPLGTVKSRLSRARALLRERLRDYQPVGTGSGRQDGGQQEDGR